MKILHVIPSIDAKHGGPSCAVRGMVRFQNKAGVRADVATTEQSPVVSRQSLVIEAKEKKETVCQGEIFSFPSCLGEYKFSLGLWWWLKKNIKNYDIVHIHSIFCFSTVAAATAARNAGIPYIVRPLGQLYPWALKNRSWMLKRAYLELVENKTIKHAAAVHFTAQDELNQCGIAIDKSKAYVLPLGVELPAEMSKVIALTFYPELNNRKILLFLSRIHPKKGLDLVLPWLASLLLKRPDWVVVIAGESESVDYLDSLKQIIRQHRVENQIAFMGQVSGDNKMALYTLAELFFLPSHSENFGIAVVEAMAMGVPVLVSDQVGVHDEITHGEAGLVFRLDQNSFSALMTQLMDGEALRRVMSENARMLIRDRFDWRVITERQIEQYQQILARNA